jgi:hypothetical protein
MALLAKSAAFLKETPGARPEWALLQRETETATPRR